MNHTTFPLPVTATDPKLKPVVSTVQRQNDGTFLVGLLFAKPCLLRLKIEGDRVVEAVDQELEKSFDQDLLGIVGGLRGTRTGDTAFATLHRGSAPLFGMFKKSVAPQTQDELWLDLANGGNALGFSYKHSLVQILDGQFKIRFLKQGGALLDAALIGDFLFGLSGGVIFREPYLNAEKRYFLREDLEPNFRLHKVEDGVFWLAGNDHRLMKLNLQDIKALPTTKKVPGTPFRESNDSDVDGWLYGIAGDTLFRVRVNTENRLDELQVIKKFTDALPLSLTSAEELPDQKGPKKKGEKKSDDEVPEEEAKPLRKGRVWVSVEKAGQAEIHEIVTQSQADEELLPEAPLVEKIYASDALSNLNNLAIAGKDTLVGSCQTKDGKPALFISKVL